MLFVANWLVIIVFWYFVLRGWRNGQHRLTVACAALWLCGRIWLPGSGLNGGLLFIVVAAILSLILIYADLMHRTSPSNKAHDAEQLLQQQQHSGDQTHGNNAS